jgi:HK97 family phage major capsid protein
MEMLTKKFDEFNKSMHDLHEKIDEKLAKVEKGHEPDLILKAEVEKLQKRADETEERYKTEIKSYQDKMTAMYDSVREVLEAKRNLAPDTTTTYGTNMIPHVVRGLSHGDWGGKGEYKSLRSQLRYSEGAERYKTLIDETGSSGGHYLIPETWSNELIPLLYAKEELFQLPLGRKTVQGGTVNLPKITGGATAYMVAAATAITESAITAGKDTLAPMQMGILSAVDNRLVRGADPSIEQTVKQDMMSVASAKLVTQILAGTGAGNFTGLETTSGIQEVSMGDNGAKFTAATNIDNLMRLPRLIEMAHGTFEGWLMNSRSKWDLRETKDAVGNYILTTPNNAGDPPLLIGYPYKISNNISNTQTQGNKSDCTSIYGGQWSEVIVYVWADIAFMASKEGTYVTSGTTYSAVQLDMTLFRMIMEANCYFRQPTTIGRIKGVRANTAT